jgi:hypothetical protein
MFAADRSRRIREVVWNSANKEDLVGTQSLCHYLECCRRANESDIALDRDFRTGWLSDVKGNKNRIRTAEAEIQRWIKQEVGAIAFLRDALSTASYPDMDSRVRSL